ncbi:MAG TPA: fatty acid desaturase [Candidatus Binatia bacterium]|nr:fatty acid desaturase [Candidatus Binatia bacterium]
MNSVTSRERAMDSSAGIPARLNLCLAAGYLILNLYQFFLLPIALLPHSVWWGLTLIPLAALNNPFWSLIHEAIHDLFHPSLRVNAWLGRLLSIFFGAPFRVVRLSHLLHHKLNRTPLEGTELYDPQSISKIRAGIGYYSYIFGGLYFLEFLSPVLFFLPKRLLDRMKQRYFKSESLSGMWFRSLSNPDAVREIRTDGTLILTLFLASFACYGENWEMLLGLLVARAFLVSFLDNVYHYRTPVHEIFYARNLWLPAWLSKAFLHFNLHGIHHRNPSIPWIRLREIFTRGPDKFSANYFAAAWSQLYGPTPLSSLLPEKWERR